MLPTGICVTLVQIDPRIIQNAHCWMHILFRYCPSDCREHITQICRDRVILSPVEPILVSDPMNLAPVRNILQAHISRIPEPWIYTMNLKPLIIIISQKIYHYIVVNNRSYWYNVHIWILSWFQNSFILSHFPRCKLFKTRCPLFIAWSISNLVNSQKNRNAA